MSGPQPRKAASLVGITAALAALVPPRDTQPGTTMNVFERLAAHEIRLQRLKILRDGWRQQCARPECPPDLKHIAEKLLDAIDKAVA